ncbi:MAG: NYN domain-containing protein [Candidatus Odinarchaeota archaeon]|nr:NYN domain-containing protein [Candidatus Odinarchaeota archaeon]
MILSTRITSIFTRKKKIALLIDGPNILRKEFNIKLEELREIAEKYGKVQIGKVYLNQYAPQKLAEAVSNSGFSPEIVSYDIHIVMALDAISFLKNKKVDLIAIASRHARCVPILRKLREEGVETLVMGFDPGFSVALKNTADFYEEISVKTYNGNNNNRKS